MCLALAAAAAVAGTACGIDIVGQAGTTPSSPESDGGRGADVGAADGAIADGGIPGAPLDASGPTPSIALQMSTAPPATSNLTQEGTVDWAHWGIGGGVVVRKATGGNVIGDYTMTGEPPQAIDLDFNGWPIAASWSDGNAARPTASNTKTHRYFVYSDDVELTLSLPASTTKRTAVLYLGGYRARGRLQLSFDDAPATILATDQRENQGYYFAARYEVGYSGSAASTKLLVRWKITKVYESTGTIILQSVALR